MTEQLSFRIKNIEKLFRINALASSENNCLKHAGNFLQELFKIGTASDIYCVLSEVKMNWKCEINILTVFKSRMHECFCIIS
jgi:hypothetical protein